jgi:hypothetical protein
MPARDGRPAIESGSFVRSKINIAVAGTGNWCKNFACNFDGRGVLALIRGVEKSVESKSCGRQQEKPRY